MSRVIHARKIGRWPRAALKPNVRSAYYAFLAQHPAGKRVMESVHGLSESVSSVAEYRWSKRLGRTTYDVSTTPLTWATPASLDLKPGDSVHVCAWIKPNVLPGAGQTLAAICRSDLTTSDVDYSIVLNDTAGTIKAEVAGSSLVSSGVNATAGEWFHIELSFIQSVGLYILINRATAAFVSDSGFDFTASLCDIGFGEDPAGIYGDLNCEVADHIVWKQGVRHLEWTARAFTSPAWQPIDFGYTSGYLRAIDDAYDNSPYIQPALLQAVGTLHGLSGTALPIVGTSKS